MTRCNHISWLDLVEGEAGPHILHGWRYSQILQSFQNPSEQCPQTILLLGKKEKDIALRRLCKSRDRSRVPGSISIRADGSSERSQYPRIFADWNPQSREVRPAFNSPRVCHREENIPVNWPRTATWDPYDLVLSRLLFLFCDIICIFSEDIGGMEATQSLLTTWANIGSASTLPDRIRPRVIVISSTISRGCVTERVLEEEDFLNNILYSKTLSASFTDIKVLSLPSNDNVTIQPEYLDNLISRRKRRDFNPASQIRATTVEKNDIEDSNNSVYEASDLDNILISHFGNSQRMFDTPKSRVSGWKVAITSSTIDDGSPILFTNYHGEAPPRKGRGLVQLLLYQCYFYPSRYQAPEAIKMGVLGREIIIHFILDYLRCDVSS
ncbi:hypothetical protein TESG_00557 [Trichophyton tonsurans CBS 112818]|uniref:Uncharacterized protein n=1 Tax=Trichophyton tonsurans (strain CBS 112818) TaxID=647933 RepID=F2RNU1_TRIT1|nr:hypothetical protein TESG_00557 [Trichophyton tonsurans CBS 112818]